MGILEVVVRIKCCLAWAWSRTGKGEQLLLTILNWGVVEVRCLTWCILKRTGVAKKGSGASSLMYGVSEVLGETDELPPLLGCWVLRVCAQVLTWASVLVH